MEEPTSTFVPLASAVPSTAGAVPPRLTAVLAVSQPMAFVELFPLAPRPRTARAVPRTAMFAQLDCVVANMDTAVLEAHIVQLLQVVSLVTELRALKRCQSG